MNCRDVITQALYEIKAYAAGETPSADDAQTSLQRLQNVCEVFYPDVGTLTLDTQLPGGEEAILYELAYRLTGVFGVPFTPEQGDLRQRSRSRLQALLRDPEDVPVDEGLLRMSSNPYFISFETGEEE